MWQVTNTEQNVTKISDGDRVIHLIGTAHVSSASAELVGRIISEVKPDTVAVELCAARFTSLKDPDRWRNTNLVTVIKAGRAYLLLAQLVLAGFQKRLGKKLNIQPGAEMMKAISAAESIGAKTALVDRDLSITLKRTARSIGFWRLAKLLYGATMSLFKTTEISAEEIERLKSADALTEVLDELSGHFPTIRKSLIDERDQFMASHIRDIDSKNIVAVVGAAHVPGIVHWINKPVDLATLNTTPKKGLLWRISGWVVPALFLACIVYGFVACGSTESIDMLKAWAWCTSLFAALGAAVARAHPLTVVAAFLVAPFASLNPFIAAGWVAGLVEAVVRKPRVSDIESIADDLGTVSGAFRNRVSRTLLIVAAVNIFVLVGMAVGAEAVYSIAVATTP